MKAPPPLLMEEKRRHSLLNILLLSDGKPEAYRHVRRQSRKLVSSARHSSDQLPESFIIANRRQIRIVLEERFVFIPERD